MSECRCCKFCPCVFRESWCWVGVLVPIDLKARCILLCYVGVGLSEWVDLNSRVKGVQVE